MSSWVQKTGLLHPPFVTEIDSEKKPHESLGLVKHFQRDYSRPFAHKHKFTGIKGFILPRE